MTTNNSIQTIQTSDANRWRHNPYRGSDESSCPPSTQASPISVVLRGMPYLTPSRASSASHSRHLSEQSVDSAYVATAPDAPLATSTTNDVIPHEALQGKVSYTLFPDMIDGEVVELLDSLQQPDAEEDTNSASTIERIPENVSTTHFFFGQLPFDMTPSRLTWLIKRFSGGIVPRQVEPVLKHGRNGKRRVAGGCLYAAVDASDESALQRALHNRVLVDKAGVWYAATAEQQEALDQYIASLGQLKSQGLPTELRGCPTKTVTIQKVA